MDRLRRPVLTPREVDEVIRLNLSDVDRAGRVLCVRSGKHGKDQIIPVGARQ